jgi:Uma2 family endonuclease
MASARQPLPPLLPGQGMTGEEFLARWEAMPELKNAELLDGIVYMASPVGIAHGDFDGLAVGWLARYAAATRGVKVATNTTWVMEGNSIPQPDIALYIPPEYGGRIKRVKNLATGAPELIVEISYSSADRDFDIKKALYQRSSVREYITVDLLAGVLTWRVLESGVYSDLAPDVDGLLKSRIFPGLWLDVAAFWVEDGAKIAAAVDRGIAAPEHAQFVAELASRRA